MDVAGDEGFTVRQIRDGIAGGACALLPLLVVNVLGYLGLLTSEDALLAGALALIAGPPVGGVVAGLLGARPRARHAVAAGGALVAGLIAGGVYLATLLGVVVVAAQLGAEPLLLAEHPLRVGGALVCVATVLAAIALGVGALVGRSQQVKRTAPVGHRLDTHPRPRQGTATHISARTASPRDRTSRQHVAAESSKHERAAASDPHARARQASMRSASDNRR